MFTDKASLTEKEKETEEGAYVILFKMTREDFPEEVILKKRHNKSSPTDS